MTFELLTGDLSSVSTYTGTVTGGVGDSFTAAAVPALGDGAYYLVRKVVGAQFCNNGSWSGVNECVLSDTTRPWWPAPGSGGIPPTCDRDADIP